MTNYISTIIIDQPVRNVYDFLTDQQNTKRWLTGLQNVIPLSGIPGKPGYTSEYIFTENAESISFIEKVINIQPYEHFTFQMDSKDLILLTEIKLSDQQGKTKVTISNHVSGKNLKIKIMLPFLKKQCNEDRPKIWKI